MLTYKDTELNPCKATRKYCCCLEVKIGRSLKASLYGTAKRLEQLYLSKNLLYKFS